jgi:crotonobetainyl-CoA:carnitine CoA-transferase CaiB-like acyl-CoA transferase
MPNSQEQLSLLSGYTILDLSDNKGYTCGRFLASLGADVIKVEAPGGDPERHLPTSALNDKRSVQWLAKNIGKRSITLNLDHAEGRELFRQLVKKSHFVIESFTPGTLAEWGLDYEQLSAINPEVILVSISPFGQSGPYAKYQGGELVSSAMGGTLDTCGYPGDTPVLEALDACIFHANAAASLGAMIAHLERGLSGKGQHVDCSIQETAATRNTNNLTAYQFDRRKLERSGNKIRFGIANVRVIWELADGYCFHSMMTGKFGAPANAALSNWMTEEGYDNPMQEVNWDNYDRASLDADVRLQWEQAMGAFFKSKTKREIASEGAKRGIRATIAQAPEDIVRDEHLQAREFLAPVDLADKSSVQYPDYFIRLKSAPYRLPHRMATAGEHNAEIYTEKLDLSSEQLAEYKKQGVL